MRHTLRSLSAIAFSIAILVGSISCSSKSAQAPSTGTSQFEIIKKNKKILAGWAPYAPYASLNPQTKQPEGFYIDLFTRMAQEGGFEITWVETTWSTMISDLKAEKFEVMAAPVFRTIPRSEEVAFTRSIDYFGLSAIVRNGDQRFKEPTDFNRNDVTLAVTQGEVGHEFATRRLPNAKLIVHESGDISLALVDVIEGRADAGICDSWTAKLFAQAHAEKVKDIFDGKPFDRVGAGWFVQQGQNDLLVFLNTGIDWLQTSGTIDEVSKKYQLASSIK